MQTLTIAGNVGKDPELRRTPGGDPVLNFTLAVDNGKDKDGNKRQATWFDCAIWGKRAESLQNHIAKGSKLVLRGRPTARAHDGKAYLGITVDDLTFMGGSRDSDTGAGAGGRPGGTIAGGAGMPDGGWPEDEIPFSAEWRI